MKVSMHLIFPSPEGLIVETVYAEPQTTEQFAKGEVIGMFVLDHPEYHDALVVDADDLSPVIFTDNNKRIYPTLSEVEGEPSIGILTPFAGRAGMLFAKLGINPELLTYPDPQLQFVLGTTPTENQ